MQHQLGSPSNTEIYQWSFSLWGKTKQRHWKSVCAHRGTGGMGIKLNATSQGCCCQPQNQKWETIPKTIVANTEAKGMETKSTSFHILCITYWWLLTLNVITNGLKTKTTTTTKQQETKGEIQNVIAIYPRYFKTNFHLKSFFYCLWSKVQKVGHYHMYTEWSLFFNLALATARGLNVFLFCFFEAGSII